MKTEVIIKVIERHITDEGAVVEENIIVDETCGKIENNLYPLYNPITYKINAANKPEAIKREISYILDIK